MNKSYVKYLAAVMLFGSNGIVASHITLSSYVIVLFRTLIGGAFLTALFFAAKRKATVLRHKKDFLYILISGVAMGVSWMFLYEAYRRVGVSVATLLYYTGPVMVMALSPALFGEKLAWYKILGFIVVLCGVLLVNGLSFSGGANAFGMLCGIMSAATYCVMVVANKRSREIKGMENALVQMLAAFVTVALFVGAKGGFAMEIKSAEIPWILALGVINTGIGCYFYFSSIGEIPIQTVAVCGYLEPLSAVVFSAVFLSERMSPIQISGAALIILGALFAECAGIRKRER